jgi:uncharacterized protein YgiM (DUF1202 family)
MADWHVRTAIREDPAVDALTIPHQAHGTAICTGDGLRIREQPNTEARILATLAAGERVTVWAVEAGWMIVQTANGSTGWASAQYLRVVGDLVA